MLSQFKAFILPSLCVLCERVSQPSLCDTCYASISDIDIRSPFRCAPCATNFFGIHSCMRMSPLDAFLPVLPYQYPRVKRIIHMYKYYHITNLASPLGDILAKSLAATPRPFAPPQRITYVPLHIRRQRMRGFNQAFKLAARVSAYYHVPLDTRLIRTSYTTPQMHLSATERKNNLRNAFTVTAPPREPISPPVILIDDVATTLTTLRECAAVLKHEGAPAVYAVSLAG